MGFQTPIPGCSTTEAEYIAMSQSLRDIIPIMGILQEMKERNFNVLCTVPSPMCTVRCLKTILAPLNWQGFLSFALGPSTLTYDVSQISVPYEYVLWACLAKARR